MSFEKPILYLVFRRLDHVKKTFEPIKRIQPKKLYVACDGHNNKEDKIKIDKVRKYILESINWKCKVKTLFRKKNLGCKIAVSSAITWFFKNETEGIILEDDCLANDSFFPFCSTMLDKYKDDTRIMNIGGFQPIKKYKTDYSYIYGYTCSMWGWASWRRAWKYYDINMKTWPMLKKTSALKKLPFANKRRQKIFELTFQKKISTWDYQWGYASFSNHGLWVIPAKNLIQNIGFGGTEGTNTNYIDKKIMNIKAEKLNPPYLAPKIFLPDVDFEKKFTKFFSPSILKRIKSKLSKVKRGIYKILKIK